MSQHDYIIDNAAGASVRADINNALAAIVGNNSGAAAPATPYAYQWWADTTTGLLKQRDAANSAWVAVGKFPVKGLTPGTDLVMNPYAANTTQAQAHGLGQTPDLVTGYVECLTNDLNYVVGNRIDINTLTRGDRGAASENGFVVQKDGTNLTLITANGGGMTVLDATTRVVNYITAARWKVVLTPWRIG